MNEIQLPYYISERTFRKFENHIATAAMKHPEPLKLDHTGSGFNENSFVARLRDSLASYRKHKWPSKVIRPSDLEVIAKLKVIQHDGGIYMGTAEVLKAFKQLPPMEAIEVRIKQDVEPFDATKVDPKVICLLAAKRLLTQPIPFVNLSDEQVAWLEDNFDIVITKQTNEIYLIE